VVTPRFDDVLGGRHYVEGLVLPPRLAPELARLLEHARRSRPSSPGMTRWLGELDAMAAVMRRGQPVRLSADPYAGWLSVAEAAAELGYTDRHVRRECDRGGISAEKPAGSDGWRIPPVEVARRKRERLVRMSAADRTRAA
jgi:excisionase family DNA binding protein